MKIEYRNEDNDCRILFTKNQIRYIQLKEKVDRIIAFLALLVLFLPGMLLCLIQKITSPYEPVLFCQERVGKNNQLFRMYKFRSMNSNAPIIANPELDNPQAYMTKFGKFLRDTSIDELPQLINVLKGEMSIIGPRPLMWQEEEIRKLRLKMDIYSVLPGITGLAQVNGRNELQMEAKVAYDRQYIENIGWKMDLLILFRSVQKVLGREGIYGKKRREDINESFNSYGRPLRTGAKCKEDEDIL